MPASSFAGQRNNSLKTATGLSLQFQPSNLKPGGKGVVPLSKMYSSEIGDISEEQRKLRISLEREQV